MLKFFSIERTPENNALDDDRGGSENFDEHDNFDNLKIPIISQIKGRKRERSKSGIEMSKFKKSRKCD